MSKQLSFCQPFHERSSFDRRKSSKLSPTNMDPPLQILHESSSDGYNQDQSYYDSHKDGPDTPLAQDEYPPAMQKQPYSQDSYAQSRIESQPADTSLVEEPLHNRQQRAQYDVYLDRSLDACNTSELAEMPKVEKPNVAKFKTEKQLLGCASAMLDPRRQVSYKKKRNPSATSHERPGSQKMVPMSTQDYYARLKEMQSRLERARNEISGNVSRSRSRSRPASPKTTTSQAGTTSAAASHKIPDYLKRVLNTSKSSASKII